MTEQQRKAIEILNGIKNEQKLDGKQVISDDDTVYSNPMAIIHFTKFRY